MQEEKTQLSDRSQALLESARELHESAATADGAAAIPLMLDRLEETLRLLKASWTHLAAAAVPQIERRRAGEWVVTGTLSREQEVQLMATLHDLATELGRLARASADARSVVVPLIARRAAAEVGLPLSREPAPPSAAPTSTCHEHAQRRALKRIDTGTVKS